MMTSRPVTFLFRAPLLIIVLSAICCSMPQHARAAVQWHSLARTGRHDVAIDTGSIRQTSLGRLAVWLRFTPQGEAQRREAAAEYGQKAYQLHLEYYEIDCSEQNALLGLIDILGPSKRRLARMKGNESLDAIIPGSVLDIAAQKICPAMEEEPAETREQPDAPDSGGAPAESGEKALSEEARQLIAETVQATESDPANPEAWRALGNAYYDADLPEKAIEAYNRSLVLKPDDTDILNDQGAMYRQTGDFARALSNFERARKVDPYNLESIYNSGYVLAFDLNQIDKAVATWKLYLALDRSSETARQVQSFVERYGKSATNGATK